METKQDELVAIPLKEFQPGRRLHFKFRIPSEHEVHCPAEFVAIVRGRVRVKCLDGWTPDWYSSWKLEQRWPGRIATVAAKNCYLFGKEKGTSDAYCHWFENTRDPVQYYEK